MLNVEKLLDSKRTKKILTKIPSDKKDVFCQFIRKYPEEFKTKPRRVLAFIDILNINDDDYFAKYERYISSPNSFESKEIRFGKEYTAKYKKKLLNRPKIDRSNQNSYDPKFLSRVHNISEDEAKKLIAERKRKDSLRSKKMHQKLKKEGYSYRKNNPMCIEYWLLREKTKNIAEEKYKKYIEKTRTNKKGFEIRHGKEKAEDMFEEWCEKRKQTWLKKYGSTIPMPGRTSKESLIFFIPLYKKLRKMGFQRDDIYWGIKGSREFANRTDELGNFFFDFTIKSIKYIIEYHGSFWHPHPDKIFKGFIDENKAIERDLEKKKYMESLGYKVKYVWDFQNHNEKSAEIIDEIRYLVSKDE